MDPEGIAKSVVAVVAPLATLVRVGGRRRRLRNEIRENLALLGDLEKDDVLREHTPAAGWLQGRIALDVARLTGRPLGAPKKPIPWGSVVAAAVLTLVFGLWTLYIIRNGFVWYSVFPGTLAFLMAISIMGMTTNRELPPDETGELPAGATPIGSDSASDQIATPVSLAAAGRVDERFGPTGQVGVVLSFFRAMREGRYEDGLSYADEDWTLCRIQAWLWNNTGQLGRDIERMQLLAESLLRERAPAEVWADFVTGEARTFIEAWGSLDPDAYGASSRRRRLSREHDLVVLAPVGRNGGYFVTEATVLPNALIFVVRRTNDGWLVANHVGTAPPQPGWPPIWWTTSDPAVEALPDS